MNSKTSKTSDPNVLILNLAEKIGVRRSDKYVALSNLTKYYAWKNIEKNHTTMINLKYQLQCGVMNLNYLMDHTVYQIFKAF